jgi:chromosome segregation protein
MFHYTPSPFCILGRVDALDESNVDRFTRLIQQMSHHTQFILILQQGPWKSAAPSGVTMEGASIKLVSVRLRTWRQSAKTRRADAIVLQILAV